MTCEAARREATVYIAAARTAHDRREEVLRCGRRKRPDRQRRLNCGALQAARGTGATAKSAGRRTSTTTSTGWNAHVVPLIGKRLVSSLTAQDIGKLRDDITEGKPPAWLGDGVRRVTGGSGTATRTIRTFKSVLSYCVDRQSVPANAAIGVKLAGRRQS
ncbi:MAG: hypothetical protein R3C58_13855 [Parvularculaceae bacterium]